MKKTFLVLCTICFILGFKGFAASAVYVYEDIVDWNEVTLEERGCKLIDDKNWGSGDLYPFEYEHNFDFPEGSLIETATLTLSHYGNYSGWLNPELWFISPTGDNNIFLGELEASGWQYGWVDQTFTLHGLIGTLVGESWSLALKLEEGTGGWLDLDILALDKSVLSGTYSTSPSPSPIPSTVWLFGAGLIGLAGIRRKLVS